MPERSGGSPSADPEPGGCGGRPAGHAGQGAGEAGGTPGSTAAPRIIAIVRTTWLNSRHLRRKLELLEGEGARPEPPRLPGRSSSGRSSIAPSATSWWLRWTPSHATGARPLAARGGGALVGGNSLGGRLSAGDGALAPRRARAAWRRAWKREQNMVCERGWLEILSAWQDGEASLGNRPRSGPSREVWSVPRDAFGNRSAPRRVRSAPDRMPAVPRHLGGVAGPAWKAAGAADGCSPERSPQRWWPCSGATTAPGRGRRRAGGAPPHRLRRTIPCDFTSSNPTAVRAWVAANVGYEVEVPEIPGATLLGARRCTVHGGVTASLLYRRGAEPISLFLPQAGTSAQTEAVRMSRGLPGWVGRLGAVICARSGLFAVAETRGARSPPSRRF